MRALITDARTEKALSDLMGVGHRMGVERGLPWKSSQCLARVLTTVLFDLKVYGRQHVPRWGGALIVSNHQSYLDPVLLAVRLDRPLNYIAKSELFEHPLGSWLLRHVFNAFPVRQGAGDVSAVRETIHRLRGGHLLNIYPEGGRSTDGEIAELQKGVALIIRRANVPVIPAVIDGSYHAWRIGRPIWQRWPIQVAYGPAMNLSNLDSNRIITRIDRTLRAMFATLRTARGNPSRSA